MPIPVPGRLAESMRRNVVQVQGSTGNLGSGVVVMPGQVVTNAHVLKGSETDVRIEDWEGARVNASLARINRSRDLALLSVPALKSTVALPLGDSRGLRAGTPVFAIGNPFGFVGAVSSGVIHNMGLRNWICADVRLAPGNSGGPLIDFKGQLMGINTMIVNGGLALAVPSRALEKFLKHDDSANLGVTVRGVTFRQRFGILVTEIAPGSPAERASLLPGDILTGANGTKFERTDDLSDAIDAAAGGLLQIEFYRGDGVGPRLVTAELKQRSTRAAA